MNRVVTGRGDRGASEISALFYFLSTSDNLGVTFVKNYYGQTVLFQHFSVLYFTMKQFQNG